jgi:protein disulfide-isomerase A6
MQPILTYAPLLTRFQIRLTFGFPAVVAISIHKGAYAVMRRSFSEKAVTAFLHGVTTGRQPTVKFSKLPAVVSTEPWDGSDGAPIEDEIPLSEIMGWDDDDDEKTNGGGEL